MSAEKSYEILIPLFSFEYYGKIDPSTVASIDYGEDLLKEPDNFEFLDSTFILKKFNYSDDLLNENDFFSDDEKREIFSVRWAISIMANDTNKTYRLQKVSLFLIVLRMRYNTDTYIQYYFCKENSRYQSRIDKQFLSLPEKLLPEKNFLYDDLVIIDSSLKKINTLFETSYRFSHAIQFAYLGFTEYYGLAGYILFMTSLESLYLPYEFVQIKNTLKERVIKLINNHSLVDEAIIDDLYTLRSDIIHGKLKANLKLDDYKDKLKMLQRIVLETFKKIIDDELIFIAYHDEITKEKYFNE